MIASRHHDKREESLMVRSIAARRVCPAAIPICMAVFAVSAANANPLASHMLCSFTGIGNLNPPIPYPPAGLEQDGLFSFRAPGTCTVNDAADGVVKAPVAVNLQANGYYTNMAVGTGNLAGAACMTGDQVEIGNVDCPASPWNPTQANLIDYFQFPGGTSGNMRFGFGIDFVAGHARVYDLGGGGYGPEIEVGQTGPDAYHLWGAVDIIPNQLPPAAVSSFTVIAAFSAES